nr:DEAD/DEAH box helicase [Virgisporangium aliadipatigenens]
MTTVEATPSRLLERLLAGRSSAPLTHLEIIPARAGDPVPWPEWVPDALRDTLRRRGITHPWRHQAEAAEHAHAGRHVVVATGTASGKSLAYQLPTLSALLKDPRATAIYLSPTKALAADQLRSVTALGLPDLRPACYDGDTPREERDWIRQHSRFVLTNPDMIHHGVLPRHGAWATQLRRLAFVVVDECHGYRGVFGSHVAHVLRRLRRIAARYGSSPVFVFASATAGSPGATAAQLMGADVVEVVTDGSPRGALAFALWEPPLLPDFDGDSVRDGRGSGQLPGPRGGIDDGGIVGGGIDDGGIVGAGAAGVGSAGGDTGVSRPRAGSTLGRHAPGASSDGPVAGGTSHRGGPDASMGGPHEDSAPDRHPPGTASDVPLPGGGRDAPPVRRSALRETADLLADAVSSGIRTLAFVRSRRGAEAVAAMARRALDEASPGLGEQVAAYRSGYLREERRALERALLDGSLTGLASTSALELGVDLVGLDAVVLAGYPGRLASLWQQAGRAGRTTRDALCVLVARDDPLDTYLVHHPEALFGRPVEACVLDPLNPYVLGPQLAAAACDKPLTAADLEMFGGAPARAMVDRLVANGSLRKRPTGWYWTKEGRPEVDLRGAGGAPVAVVEAATGRLLGTVDHGSSHFLVHPGAVYQHQGVSFVVDELDLDDAVAFVHEEDPQWTTHPRDVTSLAVRSVRSYVDAGPVGLYLGDVEVTAQVTAYQRRKLTGEVIDTRPLDLPQRRLHTVAVWWTVSPRSLTLAGVDAADVPGALHAAEHAAIGLLPLVASCDRWDIGGISTAEHPDTEAPSVFVYDGHPGGAGFAERAYAAAARWLDATRAVIVECGCEAGCPSCVQSPKCGNGNSPLDKAGAVRVLDLVLRNLPG